MNIFKVLVNHDSKQAEPPSTLIGLLFLPQLKTTRASVVLLVGQAVANSQGPEWTAAGTRLIFRGRELGDDSTLEARPADFTLRRALPGCLFLELNIVLYAKLKQNSKPCHLLCEAGELYTSCHV